MNDIYGAGNVWRGERTVFKNGVIKFDKIVYQSNDLIDWVGDRVFVQFDGMSVWASYPISIYSDKDFRHLVTTIKQS